MDQVFKGNGHDVLSPPHVQSNSIQFAWYVMPNFFRTVSIV